MPRILKSYTKESFIFLDNFIRMVFYFNVPVYDDNSEDFRNDFGKTSEGFTTCSYRGIKNLIEITNCP